MNKKYEVSFIGLGKLGLPLATNMAKNKIKVLAIDTNKELISKLKEKKSPWVENNLKENIFDSYNYIDYSTSYSNISETDFTIILVNTPSTFDGSFSNQYVINVLEDTCLSLLNKKKKKHHFILSSTVMPGSIYSEFIPLIERITGWKLENEFSFSYVPDFVAIGQVIRDFEAPDFLLIGSSSKETASTVLKLYSNILLNNPPIRILTLEEAELAKVSLNAYLTTKISFANFLGVLAEKMSSDINVDNITEAIGLDKRIGNKYFTSGGPYGGTCFPRDTWAFIKVAKDLKMRSPQMNANEEINELIISDIFNKIRIHGKNIGFIGLGFKPGTSVTTEGIPEKLLRSFDFSGYNLFVHDKYFESYENLQALSSYKLNYIEKIKDLVERVDVLVFCNPDKSYKIDKVPDKIKIIDPWRVC